MEQIRKPFQGVLNIIRFNWHFYSIAITIIFTLFLISNYVPYSLRLFIYGICFFSAFFTALSLLASFYIYDLSGIYNLKWVSQKNTEELIVNINAGFDETSFLLKEKFKSAELLALDFYDPDKHTEISIKRARRAYPVSQKTKKIKTTALELSDKSVDKLFVIFSAHEIRNDSERIAFFKELNRVLKPNGEIYITEHLRDVPNFLVYTIGCFHFYSKHSWLKTFKESNLKVKQEIKMTPFVSTFILDKNGNTF